MKKMDFAALGRMRHARYAFAVLGPVGSAGAQFLLTLQLLHAVPAALFGSFSFLIVASNLSTGISSALFCAPLPRLLAHGDEASRGAVLRCLSAVNLLSAFGEALLFLGLGIWLSLPLLEAGLFALFAGLMLLRWYARARAYALSMQGRSVASDLVYGAVLLSACAAMVLCGRIGLAAAAAGLCLAALASLFPFGAEYLRSQFLRFTPGAVRDYGAIWRAHSGWSLTGVLTTEATANAHAYIVTAFSGPAEFARLAASALLIRPIAIAMNALVEYERPQLARQLHSQGGVAGALRFFRLALLAIWLATAAASLLLILFAPRLMFPARYALADMVAGCCLWLAASGVRVLRTPENVLLQAAGRFRPLAFASVVSSGVSVLAVAALLVLAGPLWSIAGIVLGELIFAIFIWRAARQLGSDSKEQQG